jgi:hypothetical protein
MKQTYLLPLLLALFVPVVQAQITYDKLEVGAMVQDAIGLGFFVRPFPLPEGQWKVMARTVTEMPLVNSRTNSRAGSVDRYLISLKNNDQNSLLTAMIVSITDRRANLDLTGGTCNSANVQNQLTDAFSDRSENGLFACAISVGMSNFRKLVAGASRSDNAWVKMNLAGFSEAAASFPDNVVVVDIAARRYRGQNLNVSYLIRQEGNLNAPAYANHLKPWVHATGLSILSVVENKAATIALPKPFIPSTSTNEVSNGNSSVQINNQVQSTFSDAVPLNTIKIQSHFDFVDVTPANFREVLLMCIPKLAANSKSLELPRVNAANTTYAISNSSRMFLLKNTSGLCVSRSSTNFPIFAGDAFMGTANPVGVPDDVADRWSKQLATLLAEKGVAGVAYTFSNGDASIVQYWVNPSAPLELNYTSQQKKAGEWESQELDARFSDAALTSLSLINTNAKGEGKKKFPY